MPRQYVPDFMAENAGKLTPVSSRDKQRHGDEHLPPGSAKALTVRGSASV